MNDLLRLPMTLLMLGYQSVVLAISQIWSNKVRSFLTTLGIMIGVAAVAVVVAGMTGAKAFVLNEFATFGANKLFVIPRTPDTGRFSNASFRQIRFTPENFDNWEADCPSVAALTRYQDFRTSIQGNGEIIETGQVGCVESSWHEIENRTVEFGREIMPMDNAKASQICLISKSVRDKLGLDRDCIGQSILISDRRFLIVGVLEDQPESVMIQDSSSGDEVFIPFRTGWAIQESFMYIRATAISPESADDARAELRGFTRTRRALRPDDPDTFRIPVMQSFIDNFKTMSSFMTSIAVGVVAISLLVGGVGIMNIMLVSVSERTREIGLRKAVGALPSAVMLQFLVEAVLLCCIGGGVGLGVGFLLTLVMQNLPTVDLSHAYIPAWAVIGSFLFSGSVGVIFGMFPAIKGALLDPIEALRHD